MHHPGASSRRDGTKGAGGGAGKGGVIQRVRVQPYVLAEIYELPDLIAGVLMHQDLPAGLRRAFYDVLLARAARR